MRPHTLQYHHIERSLTCLHREYYRLCRLNQRLYLYLRCQYQLLPLSLTCLINDYYICVNIPFTNIPVTILLIFFVHPIQNARGLRAQGSELALCSVPCALSVYSGIYSLPTFRALTGLSRSIPRDIPAVSYTHLRAHETR